MKKILLLVFLSLFYATDLGAAPVILILTLATPSQAQTNSTASLDVPAVEHYKLVLEIDPEHHSLSGQADISIKNSGQHPLTAVPVLLYRLMEVQASSDAKGAALSFTQQIVRFPDEPAWQVNVIQVKLPTPLAPGASTTIHFKYGGMLYGYREVMAYVKDTISEDYSLLRAESMPYPIIGLPSHEEWRKSFQNKFDYQVETTVPAGFAVVCPGNQIGNAQTQAGKTIYRFVGPPESNSINIAIAKFRVLEDSQRNLRVYALAGELEAGNRITNEMRRAVDFYTAYFGPPPKIGTMGVHNGLTVIEIPDGWGSYALRGYIFQSAAAFKDPKRAGELYHEVGHLWNAMIADRIQRSRYFDEAFASYFEALAVRQFEGEQAYRALLEDYRDRFVESANQNPLGKTTAIADYGKENLGGFSYSKGTWSLYVLNQLLGEETFRRAIADFLKLYDEKPADFDDFRRSVEKSSGRDLQCWFQQWITSGPESSALLIEGKSVEEIMAKCRSR